MDHITVKGTDISIIGIGNQDYISLTDMLKAKGDDVFVADWLRNRNTVEFLGIWEQVHNPHFNYGGFAMIKSQSGLNSYKLSVKEWTTKTNALKATAGRYGGTFAHRDIAFEFGMWISPEFKIYLIKEFQRLKEKESVGWNVKRDFAKINYGIHIDAIQRYLIPEKVTKEQENRIYADEADLLNVAIFGMTAKEWKGKNKEKKGNIRDYADISQLVCLANLESLNSLLIKENIPQEERLVKLNEVAISQMRILLNSKSVTRQYT